MTKEMLYLNFDVSQPEVEMLDNYVGISNITSANVLIYLTEVRMLIQNLQAFGHKGTIQDCMNILEVSEEKGVVRKALKFMDENVQ